MKIQYSVLILFTTYFVIALIITYPLLFNFDSTIYSTSERTIDSFATLHTFWREDIVGKMDSQGAPNMLIVLTLARLLTSIFNEVFAFNLLILLSSPLAGIAMYLLAFYLTKDKWASALAGFIFAFAPLHRRYSFEWLGMAQWHWLPLYVLFLLKLDREKKMIWGVLTGLLFTVVVSENYYFGYFAAFFTLAFVLFRILQTYVVDKKFYLDRYRFRSYLLAFLVVVVLTLPITATFVGETRRLAAGEEGEIGGFVRDEWPRFAFSARPWFYLLPDVHHPVFGDAVQKIYDWLATKPPLFLTQPFYPREHSLYLGWVPLILSGVAVFASLRSKKKNEESRMMNKGTIYAFLFLGIVMMIFSAPPYATISLHKIYFPSHYLYKFFPMFRSYARFGVLVLLCFSLLAAFGTKFLLEKIKSKKLLSIAHCLLFILVFFEFLDFPPFHSVSLNPLPVYEWLAEQPGDFAILVYPQDLSNRDLLAQRTHKKRFLNPKNATPPEVREVLDRLDEESAVGELRQWGVKYLIVRDPQRDPQKDPDYWEDLGFENFEDLVSKIDFSKVYNPIKTYDNLKVYLFEVPNP